MDVKIKKFLWDIQHSIQLIEAHLDSIDDLQSFRDNVLVRDAVERRLTIIGEAAHQLQRLGFKLSYSDSLINRRNTIVHQYDDFSVRSVWRHL
ncbi:MAG: HepT-like ribonuclease domain-containing protein [Bacteroidota bacterium]